MDHVSTVMGDERCQSQLTIVIVLYCTHTHRISLILGVFVLPAVCEPILHVIAQEWEHHHVGWIVDAGIVYMGMVNCVPRTIRVRGFVGKVDCIVCDLQTGDGREQALIFKFGQSADEHARFGWAVSDQPVEAKVGRDDIYTFPLENKERGEWDIDWGASGVNIALYTYRSDGQFSISVTHS